MSDRNAPGETGELLGQLCRAGFEMLPLPSSTGLDDGLLLHSVRPHRIVTVSVWADRYAAALSVPPGWAPVEPFRLPPDAHHVHGRLADVVDRIMPALRTGEASVRA